MVVIAAGRNERGAGARRCHFETEDAAIEVERPLQIGDLEVDVPDPHARVDRGKLGLRVGFGLVRHEEISANSRLVKNTSHSHM